MRVTWVTFSPTSVPTVQYGVTSLNQQANGSSTVFPILWDIDNNPSNHNDIVVRNLYIHRVLLKQLTPGQTYSK